MEENKPEKYFSKDSIFIGLGFVIAIAILAGVFSLSKDEYSSPDQAALQPVEEVFADQGIPEGHIRRLSDGVIIPQEDQVERLYAVMIENSAEAWPLSALSKARLVFEAPVEGAIPRFMAIFDDKQEIDSLGPVRSARPYYVNWAAGLDAMYVHVGGSPESLGLLRRIEIKSVNEFSFGMFFWRATSRFAPHNVYTSIYELGQAFGYKHYEISEIPFFKYINPNLSNADKVQQTITIPFSSLSDRYAATWKYDYENGNYVRWQGGEQQFDMDRSEVLLLGFHQLEHKLFQIHVMESEYFYYPRLNHT